MTYKEFREWAESEGYEVDGDLNYIKVVKKEYTLGMVGEDNRFDVCSQFWGFDRLSDKNKKNLFEKLVELASTPLEEREEVKRYILKHKWIGAVNFKYLAFVNDEFYDVASYTNAKKFTIKELKEIKENFQTDLSEFEMIEVD